MTERALLHSCLSRRLTCRVVELGMYESLLTTNLHEQLALASKLRPAYGTVDSAEQG